MRERECSSPPPAAAAVPIDLAPVSVSSICSTYMHIERRQPGLDVMQSYPQHRTHFGHYSLFQLCWSNWVTAILHADTAVMWLSLSIRLVHRSISKAASCSCPSRMYATHSTSPHQYLFPWKIEVVVVCLLLLSNWYMYSNM